MKYKLLLVFSIGFITLFLACSDSIDNDVPGNSDMELVKLPDDPFEYQVIIPGMNKDDANRIATIGRVLFYDTDLSADQSISCASCHHQEFAFSDHVDFSVGVFDHITDRNSIALASFESFDAEYGGSSTSFAPGLFWDERARNVFAQMTETIANPNEMGMSLDALVDVVQSKPLYRELFDDVALFHDPAGEKIHSTNVLTALETFVRSIKSNRSRFDEQLNTELNLSYANDWEGFTDSENRGKDLFHANCSSCHNLTSQRSSLFNRAIGITMANNGLSTDYQDKGLGEVTGSEEHYGRFKIPNLRNVALTGPYMHDGRFESLREVIDFYSTGIQNHPNLHPQLKNDVHGPRKFKFNEEQKSDLLNFLHTLTDHELLTDEKWSDPFLR